jgi:hypothetical protein
MCTHEKVGIRNTANGGLYNYHMNIMERRCHSPRDCSWSAPRYAQLLYILYLFRYVTFILSRTFPKWGITPVSLKLFLRCGKADHGVWVGRMDPYRNQQTLDRVNIHGSGRTNKEEEGKDNRSGKESSGRNSRIE